jgi:hypothetical protein
MKGSFPWVHLASLKFLMPSLKIKPPRGATSAVFDIGICELWSNPLSLQRYKNRLK